MSSTWRLSVAAISASGGTPGPVWDWLRIFMFASPVRGSRPYGGHAIEARDSSPLFGNRPTVGELGAADQKATRQAEMVKRTNELEGKNTELLEARKPAEVAEAF